MNSSKINHYLTHHETVLQQILDNTDIPAIRIKEAMYYALFPAGKRLRPLLVYLCGELVNVTEDCLDIIAAAVELMHCYSLIHDDLPAMDNDDFRRGKLSCHRAFDEATAILVGDGMQALAIETLLIGLPKFLPAEQVIAIAYELVKASGVAGMVSGQSLDLLELGNKNIQESQLQTIHLLKTGKLILACVNMVLTASFTTKTIAVALQSYAKHLGLVFQIQDDYLDKYATNLLGKNRASDSANARMTFASLYTQSAILSLIDHHFQLAKDALIPLEDRAEELLILTNDLQQRGNTVLYSS